MDFTLSEEQESFRQITRRLLEDVVVNDDPEARAFDRDAWTRLAGELGAAGIHVTEAAGGLGGDLVDAAILLEETGRVLAPGPCLAIAGFAVPALLAASGSEHAHAYLRQVIDGRLVATFAPPPGSRGGSPVRAVEDADGGLRVSGDIELVLDGADADLVLLSVSTGADGIEEPLLVAVDCPTDGLTVSPVVALDLTRAFASLELRGVQGTVIGRGPALDEALRHATAEATVCVAADLLGVADRCLELATAHAQTRTQFGRPIGSFQAVQHKLVNVLVENELARSAVYHAAWCARGDPTALEVAASIAKVASVTAATLASTELIQVLGGIGFSWEHVAHRYYRRAHTSAAWLGNPMDHLGRLADALAPRSSGLANL